MQISRKRGTTAVGGVPSARRRNAWDNFLRCRDKFSWGSQSWLRAAFQTARRLLWKNAGPVGISAGDMIAVDTEIESVLNVLRQAEAGGFSVNVSYVS